jgi:hypothetical protein
MRILVKVLAEQLGTALGPRMTVQRAGGLIRKSDEVRSLRIVLDNDEFEANLDGDSLACTIGHSSGGIRIRSQKVDVDEWITRLLTALKAEAAHSQSVRAALEGIVIGGQK